MERNSTNDNFEHFLQQNADDFRIHPSPRVWEGISKKLDKRRRKFYFGFITFLISSSIIGYTVLDLSLPIPAKDTTEDSKPTGTFFAPQDHVSQPEKTIDNLERRNKKEKDEPLPQHDGAVVRHISSAPSLLSQNAQAMATPLPTDEIVHGSIEEQTPRQREAVPADLLAISRPSGFHLPNSVEDKIVTGSINAIIHNDNAENTQQPNAISENAQNPDQTKAVSEVIKPQRRNSKFSMMFFFTPTISYRKLSENKSYQRSSQALNLAALYDINNAVTHKPDMGLELGFTSKYALTENVKLRAGVQFNINRYDIKAFKYRPEMATIALNNGYGVDSLSTLSNYRNFNGGKIDWLQNFYFQLSVPVGVEMKLHGNDKMHIGIASTIQPTYVIGDRAYLITADYKNYAQVPWLIRRWNVNTNLETFVAYSTGKVKWQVGPQVRYQLLSSFVSEYPIKENLFDFGLKVGISINQKQ